MVRSPVKWAAWATLLVAGTANGSFTFEDSQGFLKTYCQGCHQGKSPAGGFAIQRVSTPESVHAETQKWSSLSARVRNGEMPPRGAPAPPIDQREQFTQWVNTTLRADVCAAGITPGALAHSSFEP
jgi:mono/diheme cytochrome c family protein